MLWGEGEGAEVNRGDGAKATPSGRGVEGGLVWELLLLGCRGGALLAVTAQEGEDVGGHARVVTELAGGHGVMIIPTTPRKGVTLAGVLTHLLCSAVKMVDL